MSDQYKSIISFGASTAQGVGDEKKGGFISYLADFMQTPFLNWGKRGCTTFEMISRMQSLEIPNASLIIFTPGINDLLSSSEETISLIQYKENISQILDFFKSTGSVFYMSPIPVDYDKLNLDEVWIDSYVKAGLDVAVEKEIPCLDIKEHLDPFGGWKDFLADDGLHFNSLGHEFLAALLRDRI